VTAVKFKKTAAIFILAGTASSPYDSYKKIAEAGKASARSHISAGRILTLPSARGLQALSLPITCRRKNRIWPRVPEGLPRIARRFNAGIAAFIRESRRDG